MGFWKKNQKSKLIEFELEKAINFMNNQFNIDERFLLSLETKSIKEIIDIAKYQEIYDIISDYTESIDSILTDVDYDYSSLYSLSIVGKD